MKGGLRLLSQELAVLGLDLHNTLNDEPRFLIDGTFLGALHLELGERFPAEDTRAALLQLGYLHGLRDALCLVERELSHDQAAVSASPASGRLAMTLQHSTGVSGLEITGQWPDRTEGDAVLEMLGEREAPSCALSAGYTSGWLSGVFDTDVIAIETVCRAAGGEACGFVARETSAWIAGGERSALETLELLPARALRDIVQQHLAGQTFEPANDAESFERGSAVVHVWGPVMVVPFSGPEEAHRALDLIGRDPGAREVRVVVLDLAGAIIDEGFGAAALEQVVDAVERWGAEPVLTGISPLSEPAVSDLERTHLVLRKDLPEAIAAAFQIAEALRRAS